MGDYVWTIRKKPAELNKNDRIIFSAGMGGVGQVVTVDHIETVDDIALIHTDEIDFAIEVLMHNTVKLA